MQSFKVVSLICVASVVSLGRCEQQQTFMYEKQNRLSSLAKRIPSFRRSASDAKAYSFDQYPEPLPPSPPSPYAMIPTPYENIYQGRRKLGDTKIYSEKFDYEAKSVGHRVSCSAMFDCILTHVALETKGGIPILLRGGVGYRHFWAVVRAKPGKQLIGRIRAYCVKPEEEPKW